MATYRYTLHLTDADGAAWELPGAATISEYSDAFVRANEGIFQQIIAERELRNLNSPNGASHYTVASMTALEIGDE